MKDYCICSPEQFYGCDVQKYIKARQLDPDKQWIYSLISNTEHHQTQARSEQIYINEDEWMLCKDIHPGRDTRYLVVFKNLALTTIRSLDESHVPLLETINARVLEFLKSRYTEAETAQFRIFFHYMPSVYQLHAHVSTHAMPHQVMRRHYLRHIIRNVTKQSLHYRNALILTSSFRKIRLLSSAGRV